MFHGGSSQFALYIGQCRLQINIIIVRGASGEVQYHLLSFSGTRASANASSPVSNRPLAQNETSAGENFSGAFSSELFVELC